ncbi:MAG: WD40/YVTN/BNR-like repeat-containing protein [Polyangiales bacterium]
MASDDTERAPYVKELKPRKSMPRDRLTRLSILAAFLLFLGLGLAAYFFTAAGEDDRRLPNKMVIGGSIFVEKAPTQADLNAVLGGPVSFAVGDRGTILTRAAHGPWTQVHSGTRAHLLAVRRLDGVTTVVGQGGVVLRFDRAKRTWAQMNVDVNLTLRCLAHAETLLVGGDKGQVWAQTEAGSWAAEVTGSTATLRAMVAAGDDVYAVGDGGTILYRTKNEDGAMQWMRQPSPTRDDFVALSFDRRDTLFALTARGAIYQLGLGEDTPWTMVTRSPAGMDATDFALAELYVEMRLGPHYSAGNVATLIVIQRQGHPWAVPAAGAWSGALDKVLKPWTALEASTKHRLRAIDVWNLQYFAVGERGTIVRGKLLPVE